MILLGSGSAFSVWWSMDVKIGEEVATTWERVTHVSPPPRCWSVPHCNHITSPIHTKMSPVAHTVWIRLVTNGDPTYNALHFHTKSPHNDCWLWIIFWVVNNYYLCLPCFLFIYSLEPNMFPNSVKNYSHTYHEQDRRLHESSLRLISMKEAGFTPLRSYGNLFWKITSWVHLLTDDYWVMKLQRGTL